MKFIRNLLSSRYAKMWGGIVGGALAGGYLHVTGGDPSGQAVLSSSIGSYVDMGLTMLQTGTVAGLFTALAPKNGD